MTLSPTSSRSAGSLFDAYAYLRDEKAANTSGGGFTSGDWRTRTLNTEVFDPDGIVSLAANQFTLQAGSYLIEGRAPAFNVGRHKLKVRDITAGADAGIGASVETNNAAEQLVTVAFVVARVSPTAATVYELQHRCQTTEASNGSGLASNFAVVEVYAEVLIWREA